MARFRAERENGGLGDGRKYIPDESWTLFVAGDGIGQSSPMPCRNLSRRIVRGQPSGGAKIYKIEEAEGAQGTTAGPTVFLGTTAEPTGARLPLL